MSRKSQEFTAGFIRFLGEQDGVPERVFKANLQTALEGSPVCCRVYLARVEYGVTGDFNVALCVRLLTGDAKAFQKIAAGVFASIFNSCEHMDIIVLSDEQERRLHSVASPFLEQPKKNTGR